MHISLFLTSGPYALLLLQQVKNQNVLNLFNKHGGHNASFGTNHHCPSPFLSPLPLSPPKWLLSFEETFDKPVFKKEKKKIVGTAGRGWLKCFAIEAVFINFFKMLKQALRLPAGVLPSVMWNSERSNRQPCNINWLPPSCDMNLSPPVKNEPVWDKSTNYACNETMPLFKPI